MCLTDDRPVDRKDIVVALDVGTIARVLAVLLLDGSDLGKCTRSLLLTSVRVHNNENSAAVIDAIIAEARSVISGK